MQSRCAINHSWESVNAGHVLIAVRGMWDQFETVHGTSHIHSVKCTLDIARIATHLEGLVEIEDARAVALGSSIIATEEPVLTRSGIGHEPAIFDPLTESVQSIVGGVSGGHANCRHKDEQEQEELGYTFHFDFSLRHTITF